MRIGATSAVSGRLGNPGTAAGAFSLAFWDRGWEPPLLVYPGLRVAAPLPAASAPKFPLPPLPRLSPSPGTVRQPLGSGSSLSSSSSSAVRLPPSPSTFLVVPPPPNRARRTPQLTSHSGGASRKTSPCDSARVGSARLGAARRNRQRSLTWRGAAAPWERRAEPAGGAAGPGPGSSHRPPARPPASAGPGGSACRRLSLLPCAAAAGSGREERAEGEAGREGGDSPRAPAGTAGDAPPER